MDIITTTTNTTPKSPEPESETPTRIQQPTTTKPLSFSNGVLKRHHQGHPHPHHPYNHLPNPAAAAAASVTYKECLKNHAASLGGHALDGCGEFMPAPTATAGDPASIKCAACGCHRNFHRRESDEPPLSPVIEYQPHHRHHPPPPPPAPAFHPPSSNNHHPRSPSSGSPPPISSSYYPASAPHMLLALSSGGGLPVPPENTAAPAGTMSQPLGSRKRFRTKFTPEQKEKMQRFAERVGWKMQKRDEDLILEFCHEAGVDRGVLKVWMHNNKNTFGKRDANADANANANANANNNANANAHPLTTASAPIAIANNYAANTNLLQQVLLPDNATNANGNRLNGDGSSANDDDSGANGGATNGSSSSS